MLQNDRNSSTSTEAAAASGRRTAIGGELRARRMVVEAHGPGSCGARPRPRPRAARAQGQSTEMKRSGACARSAPPARARPTPAQEAVDARGRAPRPPAGTRCCLLREASRAARGRARAWSRGHRHPGTCAPRWRWCPAASMASKIDQYSSAKASSHGRAALYGGCTCR